jgi:hypothetical protein
LAFAGMRIIDWAIKNDIFFSTSPNYYPKSNGKFDSTNKNLIRIIKREIQDNQRR